MPHHPPIRDTGGDWWGISRDLHVNFDPRGGALDLSPHNLCHEVRMAAKKVLVSWQSLGEPERSRVVTFIGGRKELHIEILSKFSDVFRGDSFKSS